MFKLLSVAAGFFVLGLSAAHAQSRPGYSQADVAEYRQVCARERQASFDLAAPYARPPFTLESVDEDPLTLQSPMVRQIHVLPDLYREFAFQDVEALERLIATARPVNSTPIAVGLYTLAMCAARVRAQQLRRSPGQRAAPPPTTTAVAPPVRAPATTPTAPPPQRVLTAAERQNLGRAQDTVDLTQSYLNQCRAIDVDLGSTCSEFEQWLREARQIHAEMVAQPSTPMRNLSNYDRYVRLQMVVIDAEWCRGAVMGGSRVSCRPDMNAINAELTAAVAARTPPPPSASANTQASAATPDITPEWSSSLAQSTAAAEARERELRARSRRVHIGANDATDCMFVGTTLVNIEWGNEGRLRMQNTCEYPVAVRWCANTQDCETGVGNLWTIRPGATWPIFFSDPENRDVRIGACRIGAQAAPIPGPSGVYTNGTVNERHLGPQTGSVSGVTEWDRNICSGG